MKQNIKAECTTGIDWIDEHALILATRAVLSKDAAADDDFEEHEIFEEIETEMMKRGTLAHASIRWEWVCEQCARLLQSQAKDFRFVLYALRSLPYVNNCASPLTLAAALTSCFVNIWGEVASPAARRRSAVSRKIVDALEQLTEHALKKGIAPELVAITADMLRQLPEYFGATNPELRENLLALPRRVEEAAAVAESSESTVTQVPTAATHRATTTTPAAALAGDGNAPAAQAMPEVLWLDAKNERALKQNLTAIADFMLTLDVANPLSYRLRRYATWYGVNAPPIKKDDKTVIQPVSENAADSYRQAVGRGQADVDICQKLEKSCHLQPFWLEGQYLSYQLAILCGRDQVAQAILEETGRFVQAHEWLYRLQFSDGSPFMSEETRQWLTGAAQNNTDQPQRFFSENAPADTDMQGFLQQVRKKASSGHMQEAMEMLENSRYAQQTPRDTALWELLVMECLGDWGMKHLVSVQARRLEMEISEKTVSSWEPDLLKRIKRLTKLR